MPSRLFSAHTNATRRLSSLVVTCNRQLPSLLSLATAHSYSAFVSPSFNGIFHPCHLCSVKLWLPLRHFSTLQNYRRQNFTKHSSREGSEEKNHGSRQLLSMDQRSNQGTRVFVQNIPPHITSQQLKDHFEVAGNVVFSSVIVDSDTGLSKGYGIVQFETTEMANRAIAIMSDHPLENKYPLYVRRDLRRTSEKGSGNQSGPLPPTKWRYAHDITKSHLTEGERKDVLALIKERDLAKQNRQYAVTDEIRRRLIALYSVYLDDLSHFWWTSSSGPPKLRDVSSSPEKGASIDIAWVQIPTSPEIDACVNAKQVNALLMQRDIARRALDYISADALLKQIWDLPKGNELTLHIDDDSRTWYITTPKTLPEAPKGIRRAVDPKLAKKVGPKSSNDNMEMKIEFPFTSNDTPKERQSQNPFKNLFHKACIHPLPNQEVDVSPSAQWIFINSEDDSDVRELDIAQIQALLQERDAARQKGKPEIHNSIKQRLRDQYDVCCDDRMRIWWTKVQSYKWSTRNNWIQIPRTAESDACVNAKLVNNLLMRRDMARHELDYVTADSLLKRIYSVPEDSSMTVRIDDDSRTWYVWTLKQPTHDHGPISVSPIEWQQLPTTPETDAGVNAEAVNKALMEYDIAVKGKNYEKANAILDTFGKLPGDGRSVRIQFKCRSWRVWIDKVPRPRDHNLLKQFQTRWKQLPTTPETDADIDTETVYRYLIARDMARFEQKYAKADDIVRTINEFLGGGRTVEIDDENRTWTVVRPDTKDSISINAPNQHSVELGHELGKAQSN